MSVQWRRELSIDGGPIDDDHRHLLEIVNRFEQEGAAGDRKALLNTLADLRYYAREHFRREEQLQEDIHYPKRFQHRLEHQELAERLNTVIGHFEGAMTEPQLVEVSWETVDLLRHWLIDHMIKADLQFRPYVLRARPVPAPPGPIVVGGRL